MHVVGVEAGAVERRRHLDLAVHALLAQDRERGRAPVAMYGAATSSAGSNVSLRREAGIRGIEQALVFLVGRVRVVAQPLQRVRRRRPRAMKIDAGLVEDDRSAAA